MNTVQTNKDKVDAFLPPIELLQKYEELNTGEDIIKLVEVEQKHRHSLQNKYLFCYFLGQVLSFTVSFLLLSIIYKLIVNGYQKEAYLILFIFGLIYTIIVLSIKKDRDLLKSKKQSYITKKNQLYNNTNHRNYYNKNNHA